MMPKSRHGFSDDRQMAVDYAGRGIRVNAVGPGSIDTPFLQKDLDGLDAIVFLVGPTSSFVTGQILMADSGYSAR